MHICMQASRQWLTHVVGTKQEVGGEDEKHEVDDGMQQQRLLEGALQVMSCTGTVRMSHNSVISASPRTTLPSATMASYIL